jgi:hypothetical protein
MGTTGFNIIDGEADTCREDGGSSQADEDDIRLSDFSTANPMTVPSAPASPNRSAMRDNLESEDICTPVEEHRYYQSKHRIWETNRNQAFIQVTTQQLKPNPSESKNDAG